MLHSAPGSSSFQRSARSANPSRPSCWTASTTFVCPSRTLAPSSIASLCCSIRNLILNSPAAPASAGLQLIPAMRASGWMPRPLAILIRVSMHGSASLAPTDLSRSDEASSAGPAFLETVQLPCGVGAGSRRTALRPPLLDLQPGEAESRAGWQHEGSLALQEPAANEIANRPLHGHRRRSLWEEH